VKVKRIFIFRTLTMKNARWLSVINGAGKQMASELGARLKFLLLESDGGE